MPANVSVMSARLIISFNLFLIHNAEPTADGESCLIAERLKFMTVQSEDSYEELQYGLFGRVVRRNPLLSQNNTAV